MRVSYSSSAPGWMVLTAFLLAFTILFSLMWVCGVAFNYTLDTCFAKDVPMWLDIIGGTVLGSINIPVAVILFILETTKVIEPPLFTV